MKYRQVGEPTERVQAQVPRSLKREIMVNPQRFGLAAEASESARVAALIEAGAEARLAELEREQRLEVYAYWAKDDERLAVEAVNQRLIVEKGLI